VPDPNPNPAPTGDIPDAWMEKIQTTVAAIVNQSITARDKQNEKKWAQSQADFKKSFEEALAALKANPEQPNDDGKNGKNGKNGAPRDDVAYQTLQKRLDEMAQRADAFEQKAQSERQARRQVNLVQTLMSALGTLNITGERADAARDSLLYRNQVAYAEEDSDDVVFRDAAGVASELVLGLRQWSKTPAAQIFIPPNGNRGAGTQPGSRGPNGGGPLSMEQKLAILADQFDRNMP
jgi:hypothetical protein